MSDTPQEIPQETPLEQIDRRLAALSAAEKQLKKPSQIPFAERQSLTRKAAKAAEELRARRGELESGGAAEGSELPEPVRAALTEADGVLGKIDGAGPSGFSRGGPSAPRKQAGGQQRGAAGGSQQRPPDRIGE